MLVSMDPEDLYPSASNPSTRRLQCLRPQVLSKSKRPLAVSRSKPLPPIPVPVLVPTPESPPPRPIANKLRKKPPDLKPPKPYRLTALLQKSLSPLSQTHFPFHPTTTTHTSNPATPTPATTPPISHPLSARKLPNHDPLPPDHEQLSGVLNHHSAELQRLADRCDFLNEWLEHDTLVLERLRRGVRWDVSNELFCPGLPQPEDRRPATSSSAMRRAERAYGGIGEGEGEGEGGKRVGFQRRRVGKEEWERVVVQWCAGNCGIKEVEERVGVVRRWRRELERSVVFHRDERLRVEIALGRKSRESSGSSAARKGKEDKKARPSDGSGASHGEHSNGAVELDGTEVSAMEVVGRGGKWDGDVWKAQREKWRHGTGRLPTQGEWEEMFGYWEERRAEDVQTLPR